ncbi:MAG: hypothetical protein ACXV45_05600 [Halobacteriota archaeon]
MLNFARAFLRYLNRVHFDPRYSTFEVFLEMPKQIKKRKAIAERIVTQADITNVLTYVKNAEREA